MKKCLTPDYTNTTQHSAEEMQQTQLPSFGKRCWLKPNCYLIIFFQGIQATCNSKRNNFQYQEERRGALLAKVT